MGSFVSQSFNKNKPKVVSTLDTLFKHFSWMCRSESQNSNNAVCVVDHHEVIHKAVISIQNIHIESKQNFGLR